MKKEIKKLQRVREYFRLSLNKPEITDKTRLTDGKRKIEQVSGISIDSCNSLISEDCLYLC